MNIDIRENNIGIVVRGEFQKLKTTPKWLLTKGIISQEEFNSQGEDCVITPNEMKYNLGPMNFVCDPTRIQITSVDISLSGRFARLVSDILKVSGNAPLKSVGINAGVLFTFSNLEDTYNFGKHYGMLSSATSFMPEPRLRSVTYEDNVKANATTPKVTIILRALENIVVEIPQKDGKKEKKDNIPLCTLDVNNHFAIDNSEEAYPVLQQMETYHAEFREKYNKEFKAL